MARLMKPTTARFNAWAERRKPRRRLRSVGYALVHGWAEERPIPIRTRATTPEVRN